MEDPFGKIEAPLVGQIDVALLKDVLEAKTLEDRNLATNSYCRFCEALIQLEHAKRLPKGELK